MFDNKHHMTLQQMQEMIDASEKMVEPELARISNLPNGSDAQRDAVVKLIMSLGFSIAAAARTFFPDTNPHVFGEHNGKFIGETIAKLKEAEDGSNKPAAARPTKSAWD